MATVWPHSRHSTKRPRRECASGRERLSTVLGMSVNMSVSLDCPYLKTKECDNSNRHLRSILNICNARYPDLNEVLIQGLLVTGFSWYTWFYPVNVVFRGHNK